MQREHIWLLWTHMHVYILVICFSPTFLRFLCRVIPMRELIQKTQDHTFKFHRKPRCHVIERRVFIYNQYAIRLLDTPSKQVTVSRRALRLRKISILQYNRKSQQLHLFSSATPSADWVLCSLRKRPKEHKFIWGKFWAH